MKSLRLKSQMTRLRRQIVHPVLGDERNHRPGSKAYSHRDSSGCASQPVAWLRFVMHTGITPRSYAVILVKAMMSDFLKNYYPVPVHSIHIFSSFYKRHSACIYKLNIKPLLQTNNKIYGSSSNTKEGRYRAGLHISQRYEILFSLSPRNAALIHLA